MPSRKSNVSVTANGDNETSTPTNNKSKESLGVEDLNLPRAIIQRLAKGTLPPNTQIQKDALLAISKSTTVFINYLASCAAEQTAAAGKKTMLASDVFAALRELEFESFLPRVEAETQRYTDIQNDKRNSYRRMKKEQADGPVEGGKNGENEEVEGDGERPAKKMRLENGEDQDKNGEVEDDGDEEADINDREEEEEEVEENSEDEDEDEVEEEVEDAIGEVGDDTKTHREDLDDEDMDGEDLVNGVRDEALDEPDSD